MSRQNSQKQNGIKLPFALQKELGLQHGGQDGRGKRGGGKSMVMNRKEQRKNLRAEKRHGGRSLKQQDTEQEHVPEGGAEDFEEDDIVALAPKPWLRKAKDARQMTREEPKPILKRARQRSPSLETSDSERSRASSPGLVLDPNSKSFKQRAAEDDAEIMALERRLGMKGKNKNKMGDEMLDFVLEGLDDEDSSRKRKREGQDWLDQKRRKVMVDDEGAQSENEGSAFDSLGEDSDLLDFDDEDSDDEEDASDTFEGLADLDNRSADGDGAKDGDIGSDESSEPEAEKKQISKKIRENPYVAPAVPGFTPGKYVPPSLRKQLNSNGGGSEVLKRQLQGHLNKLSEANLITILGEIEKLYRTNARQDMTSLLIELILNSFCIPSALQNTFIILYAAFLTAVYKVIGNDFGAELLVRVVERFDQQYPNAHAGKEALNVISLLANLFTFSLVSSQIVYDHIRLLLLDFSEVNAELLLRVVRDCGPQLRTDDPSALKGIVQMMQKVSADMAKKGQTVNVRTKVMMDTITDLKNNKMKNATNAAGFTGEHIIRMRKTLGSLNSRTLKATEPMRITRDDIANSDKKGKWWLVGASWKGNELNGSSTQAPDVETQMTETYPAAEDEVDLLALAKEYRMNTDVRRSIFVAIMSANDCRDAQTRLLRLRLSTKQEQEIAKVLLRCARAEPVYNHYYTLLAKNLSKENKKVRMGFQFGLWDLFGRMGERADDESDDEGDSSIVELHEIVNIAKMYAYLIFHDHMNLGILKMLNIGFLKDRATMFLEVLLIAIMSQPKVTEEDIVRVFSRARETPQIVKSLQYFVKRNVRKSDLVSKKDREKVKEGCRTAELALKMAESDDVD